jgi:hypothetical protein
MNVKQRIKEFYKKNKRKAIIIYLIYFVTRWTLTFVFGAQLLEMIGLK